MLATKNSSYKVSAWSYCVLLLTLCHASKQIPSHLVLWQTTNNAIGFLSENFNCHFQHINCPIVQKVRIENFLLHQDMVYHLMALFLFSLPVFRNCMIILRRKLTVRPIWIQGYQKLKANTLKDDLSKTELSNLY